MGDFNTQVGKERNGYENIREVWRRHEKPRRRKPFRHM
jgi:hypothetical protein